VGGEQTVTTCPSGTFLVGLAAGFVGNRFHFDKQKRMRQLVHRDGCSGGAGRTEKFRVNGVIGRKIGHVYKKDADLTKVFETALECAQDIGDVFDDGTGLLANVERRIPFLVNRCAGDGVVGPA